MKMAKNIGFSETPTVVIGVKIGITKLTSKQHVFADMLSCLKLVLRPRKASTPITMDKRSSVASRIVANPMALRER